MKSALAIILLTALAMISCSQKPGSAGDTTASDTSAVNDTLSVEPETLPFTPPVDGIITEEMSERYIQCAVEINNLIQQRAEAGRNYLDSLGVTFEQLSDSTFKAENSQVIENYNNITIGGDFAEAEKNIYRKYSMSEDEFIWIASHLSNPENKEIQAKVTEALLEIIAP
ncbi:hypothetical protein JW890_09215 [candidate division WOR-3 bacterium]|nr:hypothetical protein [candidate division WOR-3 bacterium]